MKLVWGKTGDEVELEVLNRDLFYYWHEQSGAQCYSCVPELIADLKIISRDLAFDVKYVNDILARINRRLPLTDTVIWSQAHLNLLHKRWVELQIDIPGIKTFLDLAPSSERNDRATSKVFDDINELIHAIEHRTKFPFRAEQFKSFDNLFVKQIEHMSNQQGNLFLSYNNLGRTCWHKYTNGEHTFTDNDTNNWDTVSTDIVFDLSPIRLQTLPQDYIDLCKQQGVPAVGLELPLAKFKDPVKWDRVKTIFRRNILAGNYFTFDVDNT